MEKPLPPLGRDDYESQMPPSSPTEYQNNHFNDAMDHVSPGDEPDRLGSKDTNDNAEHQDTNAKDSNPSVIDETQYIPLEVDTQAETQVIATSAAPAVTPAAVQAVSETKDAATKQDEVQNMNDFINPDAYAESSTISAGVFQSKYPAAEISTSRAFFERPTVNDAADPAVGFRFAAPSKPPVILPQPKITPSAFQAKISAAAMSRTGFEPEHQQPFALPQSTTESLPSKSKDITNNRHSMPPKLASPVSRVSGHRSAHKTGQGGKARGTSSTLAGSNPQPRRHHQTHSQFETHHSITAGHGAVTRGVPSTGIQPNLQVELEGLQPVLDASHLQTPRVNHVQADRRETGQQKNHQPAPPLVTSATRRSGRTKSLNGRLACPFPDALDAPTPSCEGPTLLQNQTAHSPRLQAQPSVAETSQTSFAAAVPNEKRTRNSDPSLHPAYKPRKSGRVAVRPSVATYTRETPTQTADHLAESVDNNNFASYVRASSPGLPSVDAAGQAGFDEDQPANHLPQHPFVEDQTSGNEVLDSLNSTRRELRESPERMEEEAGNRHAERDRSEERELHQDVVGNADEYPWELAPDSLPQNDCSNPDGPNYFHQPTRTPSRAQSEGRPDSRRSNQGRAMTRPVRPEEIYRMPSANSHHVAVSKVTKSTGYQNTNATTATGGNTKKTLMGMGFEEYQRVGKKVEQMFIACEEQQKLIDTQKSNIMELQQSNVASNQRARILEAEKTALKESMRRFDDLSLKYTKHMNAMVAKQKDLRQDANRIWSNSKNALVRTQKEEKILEKIEKAIKEAKDMRAEVEEFEALKKKNAELQKQNTEFSIVSKHNARLEAVSQKLHQDNHGFKKALETETKLSETLKADLDRKAKELASQIRLKEELQRQLDGQFSVCRELTEQLKQLPSKISEQLQKKDGVLANILGVENTTHSKIDEVASLVNELRAKKPETPASLVELIEDLFSRLENREQNSNTGLASLKESTTETLEGLKETVRQLSLDKDTEAKYHDRISSLEKTNGTLTADKSAREHEAQSLMQQLEEVRRELADCQDQLKTREGELTAAHAVTKEDSRLKARIQELETAKNILESQLESSNQELSKVKDEVRSVREVVTRKDQQIRGIEQKYSACQNTIKTFNDDRDKYMAAKEQENKLTCQELAKKAESQKETMKVKLESQVNNYKSRCQEKELELAQVNQKLAEIQAQLDAQKSKTTTEVDERAKYFQIAKEKLAQIQQLIEKTSSVKLPAESFQELQSIKANTKEAQNKFKLAVLQIPQLIDAATEEQQRIETKIRRVGALEIETRDLEIQRSDLLKKVEELSRARDPQQGNSSRPELREESVSASSNPPSPAPNVHDTKTQSEKLRKVALIDDSNVEASSKGTRRAATGDSKRKASLRSSSTGQSSGGVNRTDTPRMRERVLERLNGFKSAVRNSSQQRSPAPQTTGYIKPFSDFASPGPLNEIESTQMMGPPAKKDARKTAAAGVDSKPIGPSTSAASSRSNHVGTGSRQGTGAEKDNLSGESTHEHKGGASEGSSKSLDHSLKRASSMKSSQNPYLDAETSRVEAADNPNNVSIEPRPRLGMENIRGVRSGSGAGTLKTTAQGQLSTQVSKPKSPYLPTTGLNRHPKRKRPNEESASEIAPKHRVLSRQRSMSSRIHSGEIPDSQDI